MAWPPTWSTSNPADNSQESIFPALNRADKTAIQTVLGMLNSFGTPTAGMRFTQINDEHYLTFNSSYNGSTWSCDNTSLAAYGWRWNASAGTLEAVYHAATSGTWTDTQWSASSFISGGTLTGGVPTGTVVPFAAGTAPTGWVNCDGSSYSTTGAMATLFGVIGYTYGGSGANFNVPNMQGNVPVGQGGGFSLAGAGGEQQHVLTQAEMPSHSHSSSHSWNSPAGPPQGSNTGGGSGFVSGSTETTDFSLTINNTGGGGAHNNMQPYLVLNYIIKT